MFHAVEHLVHPRQRVLIQPENRLQAELRQPAVCNITDVLLHLGAVQPLDAAKFEGQVDKSVLVLDHIVADKIE